MAFVVTCPSCNARLKTTVLVPGGTLAKCPRCVTEFTLTEDSPELLEKKTPPLKSATNAKIKGDQTDGADDVGAGTPIKPKIKKNRGEAESEGVQTRSKKQQATDDAVKDRDVQKRRTRRDDADEMEERSPSARSKPPQKKKNPLYLVFAISIPLLILITGGVAYGFYSYIRSKIEPSDDLLFKPEVNSGPAVGNELFFLEMMGEGAVYAGYKIKYRNGKASEGEFYVVESSEDGKVLEARLLNMRDMLGGPQAQHGTYRQQEKHIYVWIGKSKDGTLTNFFRISNTLDIRPINSANAPPVRDLTAEASVGAEEVSIERTNGQGAGMHFNVKFKNGQLPSEELYFVLTTDRGVFLESSFLEMYGKHENQVTLGKVALPGKTTHIWIGRPMNGSLSKFTRISKIVQIDGK